MADLWKDGEVITAKKLNRIIYANMTGVTSNNITTVTLDITPDDVFDENNKPIGLVVVQNIGDGVDGYVVEYTIANAAGYTNNSYIIAIDNAMAFTADLRSEHFIFTKNEGPVS